MMTLSMHTSKKKTVIWYSAALVDEKLFIHGIIPIAYVFDVVFILGQLSLPHLEAVLRDVTVH